MEEKGLTHFGIHLERAGAGGAGPADSGASFTSCRGGGGSAAPLRNRSCRLRTMNGSRTKQQPGSGAKERLLV